MKPLILIILVCTVLYIGWRIPDWIFQPIEADKAIYALYIPAGFEERRILVCYVEKEGDELTYCIAGSGSPERHTYRGFYRIEPVTGP